MVRGGGIAERQACSHELLGRGTPSASEVAYGFRVIGLGFRLQAPGLRV